MNVVSTNPLLCTGLRGIYEALPLNKRKKLRDAALIEVNDMSELPLIIRDYDRIKSSPACRGRTVLLLTHIPELIYHRKISDMVIDTTLPVDAIMLKVFNAVNENKRWEHLAQALENDPKNHWLTQKERQVIKLIVKGKCITRIAKHMKLSEKTVYNYAAVLKEKFHQNALARMMFLIRHYEEARFLENLSQPSTKEISGKVYEPARSWVKKAQRFTY